MPKILVVDAEPVVRSAVTNILEHAGYIVFPVDTVEGALRVIETSRPDLLLTNVSLPGITGHEAMRIFREKSPTLPVLMVSGLPDEDIIRDWMGEEGWDVFPKPFSAQDLAQKIKEVLDKSHPRS